jgi:hypothetical protein
MYRIFCVIVLTLFFAFDAHAQTLGAEPLTVAVSPEYPQPYQTITITPSSNLIDLVASTVTISVNGKTIGKGSGQKMNYQVGPAGEVDIITVTATTPSGTYTKKVTLRPAGVALIMEPNSITHPFYEGGAQVASEGRLRIVALADFRTSDGRSIDPATLAYTWKSGDQILQNASGLGKSVLIADAPMRYRDTPVSITVSTADGSIAAQAAIPISPIDPYIIVYRDGPLFGPDFDKAITGTYAMASNEDSFRAVPYFFSSAPSFSWNVSGKQSGTEPVITVRTTGSDAGTSIISVDANQSGSYQSANTSFSIQYGQNERSLNIFGL